MGSTRWIPALGAAHLAQKAPYPNSVAIFTIGANDGEFAPGTQRLSDAAMQAGMQTTFWTCARL